MILSAIVNAVAMAQIVAGTLFPPSYCASFLAAKIDAAISSKRVASAFGAERLLHCNRGVFCNDGAVSRLTVPVQGGPKGRFALVECFDQPLAPPGIQVTAESAYRRFGVNFDMRKSMSSSTP